MKKFTIAVSDSEALNLAELARRCTDSNSWKSANTHGALSVTRLLEMLAADAALVISRPGSWEGSNMSTVLSSHGYEV